MKYDFGLIGLAVMGQNLVLNIERNGTSVAVFNRTPSVTEEFMRERADDKRIGAAYSLRELADMVSRPRRIMIMVKAGQPVDAVINALVPYLERGDLIVDGGNSFFMDTERRYKELTAAGIRFIGTGVSGGEEGALWGPAIMPGGDRESYEMVRTIFEGIAAKVNGEPCVTYLGPGGAGHYVKMIHNGIEYGDMQLIAEAYDVLHRGLGLEADELGRIFTEWNKGVLSSYLIEITSKIFGRIDPETGRPLVDVILDEAQQKGTGKWTSQNALDLGAPIPTITAAVDSRIISSFKGDRVAASKVISGPAPEMQLTGEQREQRKVLIGDVHDALFAAKICSYAQGMALLRVASHEYKYDLPYGEIARIWRGGCIIRAQFLDDIRKAFDRAPDLGNLLIDPYFQDAVQQRQTALRRVVCTAVTSGIPCLATSASLAYFDAYRSARLPANLTQAQRDFFGAHTYRRVDREGVFHTEWATA